MTTNAAPAMSTSSAKERTDWSGRVIMLERQPVG